MLGIFIILVLSSIASCAHNDYKYQDYANKGCEKSWEKVGCVNTLSRGKLLVYWRLDIEWQSTRVSSFAQSFICACAKAAKEANVTYFGTHFWGECFALEKDQTVVSSDGNCILADGSYQKKCNGVSEKGQNTECLGGVQYYMYKVVKQSMPLGNPGNVPETTFTERQPTTSIPTTTRQPTTVKPTTRGFCPFGVGDARSSGYQYAGNYRGTACVNACVQMQKRIKSINGVSVGPSNNNSIVCYCEKNMTGRNIQRNHYQSCRFYL